MVATPSIATQAEGYILCEQGHQHWGRAGAAGLFLTATSPSGDSVVLLQHRSPEVHEGNTWSVPGGALSYGEDVLTGAARETAEELAYFPGVGEILGTYELSHGNWSYTTVVARCSYFTPESDCWETGDEGFRWFTADELETVPLHGGLANALPFLLPLWK